MKRVALILVILFTSLSILKAQTMYEFGYNYKYKNGVVENYRAFFVRYGDGQGFFRIKFTYPNDGKERIIELDFREEYPMPEPGQPNDSSILLLVGTNPEVVKGPPYLMYDENFVLIRNPETGLYEPDEVYRKITHRDKPPTTNYGNLEYIDLLNEKDLGKDFVLEYFDQNDEIFQNLFNQEALVNETRATTVPNPAAVKMHLIFVANTEDGKIGKSCEVDKERMTARFTSIAKWLGIGFTKTIISGTDYNVDRVIKAVNNVPPGPNDIVIFYYSGHGFNYTTLPQQYPFLDLRDNDMEEVNQNNTPNIEMIYNRLVAKKFRLTLVISDCCNADIKLTSIPSPAEIVMKPSVSTFSRRNGQDLFLNTTPKAYLFSASSKGELSAGNGVDGGVFSQNFRETMEYYLGNFKSNVSWEDIWKTAKEETIKKASTMKCSNPNDATIYQCRQTPVSKLN